jgi:diaminohydroxyphosphoribosylaminopyrimidine deaminase / 5-amino-6-(5-phosphoribosylamino)uracil reductase
MTAGRDEKMMKAALREAGKGDGRVFPNPSVGAVVFRGDRILGRGHTQPPGGPHAEVAAIASARRRFGARALRGASIAVTLEPCNFQGRTGPCTEAILEARIARVVCGCRDPHPSVSGRGFRRLRRRGVEVESGVLGSECQRQHRGFVSVCERGRPWITLKLATSLDGRIATAEGESRWITGPESREFVHRLRNASDAVMVGSETALADDPSLSARPARRAVRDPIRVLLDGRLRVPRTARLLSDSAAERTWVVCRERARGIRAVREAVGRVIEVPSRSGHVDLRVGLEKMAEAGLTTVLVEGGGGLAAALLRADLVDEVHWMLAPKLIGSEGRSGLGPLELARLAEAVSIEPLNVARRGLDLHLHGLIESPSSLHATRAISPRKTRVNPRKDARQ